VYLRAKLAGTLIIKWNLPVGIHLTILIINGLQTHMSTTQSQSQMESWVGGVQLAGLMVEYTLKLTVVDKNNKYEYSDECKVLINVRNTDSTPTPTLQETPTLQKTSMPTDMVPEVNEPPLLHESPKMSPIVSNEVVAGARLRSGPGDTFNIVRSVSAGTPLSIKGRNEENTWYMLDDGTWISASLVDGIPKPNDIPIVQEAKAIPDIAPIVSKEVTDGAILRDGPGSTFNRVGSLLAGTSLSITGRNEANTWYRLAGGYWIFASLVEGTPSPDDISIVEAAVDGFNFGSNGVTM